MYSTAKSVLSYGTPNVLNVTGFANPSTNSFLTSLNATRSIGLLGPANDGTTVDKSSSRTAPEYTGSTYEPS